MPVPPLSFRSVWKYLPNLETMTFGSRQQNQTGFLSYVIPNVRRKKLDLDEALELGFLLGQGVQLFVLWRESLDAAVATSPATLPAPLPKVKDTLTDAEGVVWVVQYVQQKLLGNVIECYAQKAVA